MAWEKTFSRVRWENFPSVKTPIDETNLNKSDAALNVIDDRVIELQRTKAERSEWLNSVGNILYNYDTGEITVVFNDGRKVVYDTVLEKVAVNFDYDADPSSAHYKSLIITLDDGSHKYVDLSALITEWEFIGSGAIDVNVNGAKVTVSLKAESITSDYLDPTFLAQIEAATNNAEASAGDAQDYSGQARNDALLAKSYAIGDEDVREGSGEDNAKYYKEQAALLLTAIQQLKDAIDLVSDAVTSERELVQSERELAENAAGAAAESETNAKTSEDNSKNYYLLSKSYAVGDEDARSGSDSDNAKYYMEQTQSLKTETESIRDDAYQSRTMARGYAERAETAEANAKQSEDNAKQSENNAADSAGIAKSYRDEAQSIIDNQSEILDEIDKKLALPRFSIDNDGNLIYTDDTAYRFWIDNDGNLNYEVNTD